MPPWASGRISLYPEILGVDALGLSRGLGSVTSIEFIVSTKAARHPVHRARWSLTARLSSCERVPRENPSRDSGLMCLLDEIGSTEIPLLHSSYKNGLIEIFEDSKFLIKGGFESLFIFINKVPRNTQHVGCFHTRVSFDDRQTERIPSRFVEELARSE